MEQIGQMFLLKEKTYKTKVLYMKILWKKNFRQKTIK